ncbi:MAG: amidohydrolase [Clostridia bacterium]|nr:amidohydrolase [Clostridia bacterium]
MDDTLDLLRAAGRITPQCIELRRAIHRVPEIGNAEFRTSALIADCLEGLGLHVEHPMGTSVVATLSGQQPGPTVAFRADMDALRIQEATGLPFSSEVPGFMHACGHDFHCAGLLGTAMLLSTLRERLHGSVKLLFQPDEEGLGGAQRMIAAGCLQNVDAVFGAHVDPDLPSGTVGLKYGKMYAASDTFRVVIHGEGSHGAQPEDGIDAIAIGAQVITALQQLVSRRISPTDSAVVSVGTFHAGTQMNTIADSAVLEGILRTLGQETRAKVRKWFAHTVEGICESMGARAEIHMRESYPGIVNHDDMVELVKSAAAQALGPQAIRILPSPTMGTEDFGYFLLERPGAFYRIGVGESAIGADKPLHSPRFIADEAAMSALIALHASVALRFLAAR